MHKFTIIPVSSYYKIISYWLWSSTLYSRIEGNPIYGKEVNNTFLDIINEFDLEQQISECTRGNHILDIVLSSQPHTINHVTVTPGMSDHEAIVFNVLTKIHRHKLQPRKSTNFTKLTKRPS